MQAVCFLEYVPDVEGVNTLTWFKRCMGAVSKLSNSPAKHADPLLVEPATMFHGVLADVDADPWDMFFAGTLLAMVHSRSRWDNLKQS